MRDVATFCAIAIVSIFAAAAEQAPKPAARSVGKNSSVTFYKDVLPILQDHCQTCHRSGESAPMPFMTYDQTRPWAEKISHAVQMKMMPPWFADPRFGKFANDPSLTAEQIAAITEWANAGAPAGDRNDAPAPRLWTGGWNIPQPDFVVKMPRPVSIPARGEVEYTYEIVPTRFAEDKWVQMVEVRPSSPAHVHHAVVYIRPPDSPWLRHAPVGEPFTASTLTDPDERRQAHETTSDLLLVYAPGSSPDRFSDGMAKFVPAGSDLVFQMHYTTNGTAASDQTSVGVVFSKIPPMQRVVTLQLNNHALIIPSNADDFPVQVQGTLPNRCTLLSFFPHMHLRGKRFEYDIVHSGGVGETLLRVNYHFHWQLSYKLAEPRVLEAGTRLRATAWYDNSKNNPHNPDPEKTVTWGDQTSDEMMVGFFDVAIPATMDKWQYFLHRSNAKDDTQ
jgi:mono/diheme cytochrome c family protein